MRTVQRFERHFGGRMAALGDQNGSQQLMVAILQLDSTILEPTVQAVAVQRPQKRSHTSCQCRKKAQPQCAPRPVLPLSSRTGMSFPTSFSKKGPIHKKNSAARTKRPLPCPLDTTERYAPVAAR